MTDRDYLLCECAKEPLEKFVASLEERFEIKIVKMPAVCMTMIQAEDSVEFQPFYLGEALTTECEVWLNGEAGYGLCLGDEPVRCYCIAFIDAACRLDGAHLQMITAFLEEQAGIIEREKKIENDLILRTRVDFKLMEQE